MANLAALTMWLIHLWKGGGGHENIFAMIVALGAVPAHANLCLLVPLKIGQRWLAITTVIGGIVTAALIVTCVIMRTNDWDAMTRLAGAAAIITFCGSLALLVLARLNRGVDIDAGSMPLIDMTIVCPRCQKKQTAAIGGTACSGCGLRINITVEEPRCPQCGYLTYMLQGNDCPECGATIAGSA